MGWRSHPLSPPTTKSPRPLALLVRGEQIGVVVDANRDAVVCEGVAPAAAVAVEDGLDLLVGTGRSAPTTGGRALAPTRFALGPSRLLAKPIMVEVRAEE